MSNLSARPNPQRLPRLKPAEHPQLEYFLRHCEALPAYVADGKPVHLVNERAEPGPDGRERRLVGFLVDQEEWYRVWALLSPHRPGGPLDPRRQSAR